MALRVRQPGLERDTKLYGFPTGASTTFSKNYHTARSLLPVWDARLASEGVIFVTTVRS